MCVCVPTKNNNLFIAKHWPAPKKKKRQKRQSKKKEHGSVRKKRKVKGDLRNTSRLYKLSAAMTIFQKTDGWRQSQEGIIHSWAVRGKAREDKSFRPASFSSLRSVPVSWSSCV